MMARKVSVVRPMVLRAVALGVCLSLAACASSLPAPDIPALDLPPAVGGAETIRSDWWKLFNDPQLDALVAEALANNSDMGRAGLRIQEARAALRLADADRVPSVAAGFGITRQRASETGSQPVGNSPVSNDARATLNVSYELDLWGRLASVSGAAMRDLAASQFDRDALRISLASQVVQAYAALQAFDGQVKLFEQSVALQREGLQLQRLRLNAGDLGELDVRLLEAELATNETQILRLSRSRAETARALALLLGRSPNALWDGQLARSAAPIALSAGVPAGLPSSLVTARPDIAAAEARLRAAGARLEAARAAYLPSVALSASLGKASGDLSKLLDGPSTIWSIVASVTQPIWNAGRLDASRDAIQARQQQAELDYRDAVANAFREVRDALEAAAQEQAAMALTAARVQALQRAVALTQRRFEGGVANRLETIQTERAELVARTELVDAQRALAVAQAQVFRALGGGFLANAAR